MVIALENKSIPSSSMGAFRQKMQSLLNPVEYLNHLATLAPDLSYMPAAGYPKPLVLVYHPDAMRQLIGTGYPKVGDPVKKRNYIGSYAVHRHLSLSKVILCGNITFDKLRQR